MGYEMKFYIVKKGHFTLNKEKTHYWASIVAMFNYCQDSDLADWIDKNGKDTDQFININGTDITTDCYGKSLKEVSLPDMISYLEANPSDYRRYQPFLNLLKGFNESEWDDGNGLAVLRYGY